MPIRPPVKWHGGKRYLAGRIINFFPPHRVYLEPFGGGASVLLNKPPVDVETYNDLDHRITRLFRVLRDEGEQFIAKVELIPYSQVEFEASATYPPNATDRDKAICDFVRWRQSFGGKGQGWSYTTGHRPGRDGRRRERLVDGNRLPASDHQPSAPGPDHLPIGIRRDSAIYKEALIYCDPPYVHSTRTDKKAYHVEMNDVEHRQLASLLGRCKAKVIVSGYPSPLYNEIYQGWNRVHFDIANHAAGGASKTRATECLWMNFRKAAS